MEHDTKSLSIGKLARASGVHVETLRYYERRGLLPRPPRAASGYRRYPADAVRRVRFIRKAQALGFSLREIEGLLDLRVGSNGRHCREVREIAEGKIAEVDAKIKDLRSMNRVLARLVRDCRARRATAACPILDALRESGADE